MSEKIDATATYRKRIHEALAADPERFAALLRARWRGDDGPALDSDRSWNSRLFYVYRSTPEELRGLWAGGLCDILEQFTGGRLSRLALEGRLELLGALELAQGIDWPAAEAERVAAFLVGALHYARSPSFPPPRDLWREDGFVGQPENDLVTALLRLAVRRLRHEPVAEALWADSADNPRQLEPAIVAGRLWEIARWAVAAGCHVWLAKRIDVFDEKLEAAGCAPGNLTRLFFVTEVEHGPQTVQALIKAAFEHVDPPTPERRLELARKLDYFGESSREIRARLWQRMGDKARPIPRQDKAAIERICQAWQEGDTHLIADWSQRLASAEASAA